MTTATRAPRMSFCFWCRQAVRHDDDEARRVITDQGEEWVCGKCWLRADAPVPLDYMTFEEQEGDDDDREGQPEFNGAFR